MNSKNLISVIVNCFNGETYLENCINSILHQTYSNYEIIFLDNNSSDNSLDIIKKFSNPKIKIYKTNSYLKLYDARNLAVEKSNGEFITFLDTDDWWTKDKLKKQIEFFAKNKKIDFIYSNYYIFYSNKNKNKIKIAHNFLPYTNIVQENLKNYKIGIPTTMLKRDIFNHYRFDSKYEIIGDFDFFIRVIQNYKTGVIKEPLAYYRLHDKNFSKKKSQLYIKELEHWLLLNQNSFENKGFSITAQKYYLLKLKIKELFKKFKISL